MTKILYIPTGQFLQFPIDHFFGTYKYSYTDVLEEYAFFGVKPTPEDRKNKKYSKDYVELSLTNDCYTATTVAKLLNNRVLDSIYKINKIPSTIDISCIELIFD